MTPDPDETYLVLVALPGSLLPRRNGDLDPSLWPEMVAVPSIVLRVPVPNAPPDFAEKVEAALLRQMPEVADQVSGWHAHHWSHSTSEKLRPRWRPRRCD
jgi:hypothetical protein